MSETKSNILERVVLEISGVKIHPKEITSLSFVRCGDRFNASANPHKGSEFVVVEIPDEVVSGDVVAEKQVVEKTPALNSSESSGFSAGDLVRLNSGGPKMTVGIITEKAVYCCWFEGARYFDSKFAKSTLIKVAGSIPDSGDEVTD